MTGKAKKKPWIGGIVGRMESGCTGVEDCVNTGDITVDNSMVQTASGIAGILQGGNIIGCDNSPFCHSMDPPLSSVDLAFRELGFTAMKYLLECMSAPDTPPPPLPEPHLEQRESS